MTVLTNRDDVLPLAAGSEVVLVGRHAIETSTMGGGSAAVNAPYHVSVATGLGELLGDRVTVVDGVEIRNRPVPARPEAVTDPETGEPGIRVEVYGRDGALLESRHCPTSSTMVALDDGFLGLVGSVRMSARLVEAGSFMVGTIGVGSWTLQVGERSVTQHNVLAGTGMGEEVLSPPRAQERLEVEAGELVVATTDVPEEAFIVGLVGLIAARAPRPVDDVVREAAQAAAGRTAVVVVGLTDEQETEAVDKSTLRMPGDQDRLVSAVAASAARTVVVVNAATPVLMPWLDEVDAVLWAGLPGQEGGHAVAAALLGTIEPAGRLVTTFPAADGASPAWEVVPDGLDLVYSEGAFIGYRGHEAGLAPAPAFWFGHGLCYTSWEYAGAAAERDADGVRLTVEVTNTGSRAGREVVQVYLRPVEEGEPVRLVGWTVVDAEPGATTIAAVRCDARLWRRWDVATSSWAPLAHDGELVVARGLGDVRARVPLG
jgi:beta-glucosidase